MATIAEEAKAGLVQGLNLCPLLLVLCGRSLKRAPHPMQRAAAVGTFGRLRPSGNFEALAAGEAGMRYEIAAVARGWLGLRR